jgi:copper chaperone CopZ
VNCVKKVRSALSSVPGVIEANVEMPGKADVKVHKGKVTPDELIKAVKAAGYSAKLKGPEKEKTKS